ncbi:MAG: hypothetical protein ACO1N7_09470 [Sphingobacteriaceae bacterium]
MLQTSTDSEFNLFPTAEIKHTSASALNADDQIFYNSIKEELNKLSTDPSLETVENILKYSRSL